jgi:hypothetical protein
MSAQSFVPARDILTWDLRTERTVTAVRRGPLMVVLKLQHCSVACKGNKSQKCGASKRLNVYRLARVSKTKTRKRSSVRRQMQERR